MNLQKPTWLVFELCLAILAFLVIFQPVRRVPKSAVDTELVTVLDYSFSNRLASNDQDRERVRKEITQALKAKQVGLDTKTGVQLVSDMEVKIPVVPLSDEEKQAYEKAVLEVLSKYGKPIPVLERAGDTEAAKYVARVGPLGVYPPRPAIRLGLDLVGGTQLLLQCLPQGTFHYRNPQPFYPDAQAQEPLRKTLADLLTSQGYSRVSVAFPEDDQLSITLTVATEAEAQTTGAALLKLLRQRFPDLKASGEPDLFLLTRDTLSQVVSIIERRVNALGVAEATVQKQGADRVLVQLPGVQDPARAISVIGRLAQLEFLYVPSKRFKVISEGRGQVRFEDVRTGQEVEWPEVYEKSQLIITGADLLPKSQVVNDNETGQPTAVSFELKPAARAKFRRFTRTHIKEYLAMVLDKELVICPIIQEAIAGTGQISGQRTTDEATDLTRLLNAGALPLPIETIQNTVVSATLGRDSVARSLRAGLYGALAIFAFMVLIYGACGVLADVALVLYIGIVLALFIMFGATLTLPGIAGFILSMGMAVDANVLIFERLKEELRTDKTIRAAIEAGFARAWTAILDSNLTTVLAAIVLFGIGTGAVRGFAVTLTIGVLCSMFTAITVTRVFINQVARLRAAVDNRFFVNGLRAIFGRVGKA